MLDCFGHLNEIPDFLVCSICGERFPKDSKLKVWAKTNRDLKSIINQMLKEEEAEKLEWQGLDSSDVEVT